MNSRKGWAVVRKRKLESWPDPKGRDQFDIFTNKEDAYKARQEWEENTHEAHKLVKVTISEDE